jgi:diamine N-acetyltransferase
MPLGSRLVCRVDLGALVDLEVREDQRGRVAPDAVALAQAACEPDGHVWGPWEGDTPVGLLAMADQAVADLGDGDDPHAAHRWRPMIDASHRGRRLGAAAPPIAEARARAWGRPRPVLSVAEVEDGAAPFHERHRCRRTGRILNGEAEMAREPSAPPEGAGRPCVRSPPAFGGRSSRPQPPGFGADPDPSGRAGPKGCLGPEAPEARSPSTLTPA